MRRRLAATVATDVRLQWRNGFYYAAGFLLACWALVVGQLPDVGWRAWVPALVLGNLAVGTFFFVAGLVLLEKGEGTLEAQVVTPLSVGEYLGSKIATLTALALAEHFVLVAVVAGTDFRPLPLALGVASGAAVYCLAGLLVVVRYDSVDAFLLPASLWVAALSLPILDFAGLWTPALMALHPLQPSLVLVRGAVAELSPAEWAAALLGSAAWAGVLLAAGRRAFLRFVVRSVGTAPR